MNPSRDGLEVGKIRHPNPSFHILVPFQSIPFLPSFEVVNIFAPSPQQSLAFVLLLPCIPLSLHPSSYLAIPFRPKEAKKIARCLITTLEQRGRWFNYLGAKKFPVFKNSRIPWTGDGLKLDIQRRLRNTTLYRRLRPEESFHCFNTVSFTSGTSCGLNETEFFLFFLDEKISFVVTWTRLSH